MNDSLCVARDAPAKSCRCQLAAAAFLLALAGCEQDASPVQSAPASDSVDRAPLDGAASLPREANDVEQDAVHANDAADAMTLYNKAQELIKAGDDEAGFETAKKAMARFIAEDDDLPWMLLESIELGDRRIEVRFNMGPEERVPPDHGIVMPLSFRVWSTKGEQSLLETLDFELGQVDGEPLTAAIGRTDDAGHANFAMLAVDASYAEIKKVVLDVVSGGDNAGE